MKLSTFLLENVEPIASEWERFAATLLPDEKFSSLLLRNNIAGLLANIANDMGRDQTSEGDPSRSLSGPTSVRHALSRVEMGFSLRQVVAEFRVLRVTVVRLWQQHNPDGGASAVHDLIRFNEAVDQVMTEGVVAYTVEIDRSRELFLGMLGHDLRNPIGAICGLAELQLDGPSDSGSYADSARRILASAYRMSHMVNDLLELTRVRLGTGIILRKAPTEIRRVCMSVIDEMSVTYPKHVFHLVGNEAVGAWDERRLTQVISNLITNAVKHGDRGASPITVRVNQAGDMVEVGVHNEGPPIPDKMIPRLFESFFRGSGPTAVEGHSLGLGLYIANQITRAHGGTLTVQSADRNGTTFLLRLPPAGPA
jgi:hypothetical protein